MIVKIRPWRLTDIKDLVYLCNHVDRTYLTNSIPYPYDREDALFFIHSSKRNDKGYGIYRAIEVDGKCVGEISVVLQDDIHFRVGNLGYYLLDEYKDQGIMTYAVKEISQLAYQQLHIYRITASTFEENIASRKVLEKNHFRLEAILKNNIFKDSRIHNECIYVLFKEDL